MPSGVYERKKAREEFDDEVEAIPALENGTVEMAGGEEEPRQKRKYTKRAGRPPPEPKKKIKINLISAGGSPAIQGAARMPVFLADTAATIATKGKFHLMGFVSEDQLKECDRAFQEVLSDLSIEIDEPWQGWLLTCGMTALSALMLCSMTYAVTLKAQNGFVKAPPQRVENDSAARSTGNSSAEDFGVSENSSEPRRDAFTNTRRNGSTGMGEVHEQPRSSESASA